MGANDTIRFLAGNPILLNIWTGVNASTRYRVYSGVNYSELLYDGSAYSITGTAQVDVSELFKNLATTAGILSAKMVTVDSEGNNYVDENNEGNSLYLVEFTVYGGGISKLLQRKLVSAGSDIFEWKLKNVSRNFFLSTRTNNRIITIPEDELLLLKYYAQGFNFVLKSAGEILVTYDHSNDAIESLQEIDFNAIRQQIMSSKNKLISQFDVMTSTGGYACTIVITEVTEKHDYFLKFRNSLGVLEIISIEGLIDYNPAFSEQSTISEWDQDISDFVSTAQRKTFINVYKGEIGYKTNEERLFLIDALISKECYLMANGEEYAVKIKTDSSLFQSTASVPVPISIIFELLDTDNNYSPLLQKGDEILGTTDNEIVTSTDFKILI